MERGLLKILVIHGYSSKNRGDGLLVKLTTRVLDDAFGASQYTAKYVCIDAKSFGGLEGAIQLAATSENIGEKTSGVLGALRQLISPVVPMHFEDGLPPDLIVAVGGGYMRTTNPVQGLKALIAHGSQLHQAVNSSIPVVYLPQSVGPFRTVFGLGFLWDLRKVTRIYVRDDRSLELLSSSNASRAPDLAIYEIARKVEGDRAKRTGGEVGVLLVARHIEGNKAKQELYRAKLRKLREAIPSLQPVVQSSGRGNDDPSFYSSQGWGTKFNYLKDHFIQDRPEAIISVRLHGALESIAAGLPTVHLSYERKGFGAFDDLGIGKYVHNVYSFDPELVLKQVEDLRLDPEPYWLAIEGACSRILSQYENMLGEIRSIASRMSP